MGVIAFVGAGRTGKTTLLNACRECYGDRFVYLESAARRYFERHTVAKERRSSFSVQAQIQIMAMDNLAKARDRPAFADGSVFDAAAYVFVGSGDMGLAKVLLERVNTFGPWYERLYLCSPAGIEPTYQETEWRWQIHLAFSRLFDLAAIEYETLSGPLDKRLRTVATAL